MKVLVFGNVGSGKTTLIDSLCKRLPYSKISIDDFRRKFGDGSEGAELIAREKFFEAILRNENQFIECTGTGEVADRLFSLLKTSDEQIICITLTTPKEVCVKRLINRTWDIPFPKPLKEVFVFMDRTEIKITGGDIKKQWAKRQNTLLVSYKNVDTSDIDLISKRVAHLVQQFKNLKDSGIDEVQQMGSCESQSYYKSHYLKHQKKINETNESIVRDQKRIEQFLSRLDLADVVFDVGSGSCQWFLSLEKSIERYYAIDVNDVAVSFAPHHSKLFPVIANVFDNEFDFEHLSQGEKSHCIFSFFLSHFSDESISKLFAKLQSIDSIIIIDSYFSDVQERRYGSKELRQIARRTGAISEVLLPKRFFELSDLERIASSFNYSITNFEKGEYWFACTIERNCPSSPPSQTIT